MPDNATHHGAKKRSFENENIMEEEAYGKLSNRMLMR